LSNLKKHGKKANDLKDIINFILERKYWWKNYWTKLIIPQI
jgi:hypothetical protein